MQCLILAGGLGTRMAAQTKKVPKALIPIHEKPFAHYQMDLLAREGVRSVIFSIGHMGDLIRESLGVGEKWNVPIQYVDEGSHLLGTGGAIRKAADAGVLAENFFVLNGDSFLPISYLPVWESFHAEKKPILMTVFRNEGQLDASNVRFENGKLLYQKNVPDPRSQGMHFIDYGISVMSRDIILKNIPSKLKYDLADLLFKESSLGNVAGFEVFQRFYEIGSVQGLRDLETYIARESNL